MKKTKLVMEVLEDRNQPSISVIGGALTITGTPTNDQAQVWEFGSTSIAIQIQRDSLGHVIGKETLITTLPVTKFVFLGGDGNDSFYASQVHKEVNAFGGNGNDFLMGGLGVNHLEGGDGQDTLVGLLSKDGLVDDGTDTIIQLYV